MIAAPNPAALLIYACCALTGIAIERRLVLNGLIKRVLMIYALGAGQLMLSLEALSLAKALTGWNLILVNVVCTVAIFLLLRNHAAQGSATWVELIARARAEGREVRRDWVTMSLAVVAGTLFVIAAAVGWMMIPFNDSYHFEMPRFWLQNKSAYPFPCHNPRITTITFLSEAIELPGFVALRNDAPAWVATIIAGILTVATIYGLARRLRASVVASAAATALSVGYLTFASSIYTTAAEVLLAGAFFGGSVIFLMDVWAEEEEGHSRVSDLGCSVFLFVMACGAKNPTTVVAPFYLIFLAVAGCRMWRFGNKKILGEMTPAIVGSGMIGLLCSGVAWNYGANHVYFGESGMPRLMKSVVSHNYKPREIWTRLCRGGVLVLYDTLWMPKSAREKYKTVAEKTVKLLGGLESLPEDDPYYSFEAEPMKGFGPLGVLFLTPTLLLVLSLLVRASRKSEKPVVTPSFNVLALTTLAIASFVMEHLVLRWQSIGMVRLMFPIVVAAAPLVALLLEKRIARFAAVGSLTVMTAVFFVYWSGLVSRRTGRTDGAFFKAIARLQNDRATALNYQWKDQSPRDLLKREHYTFRQVYETILEGLRQPCTIGFIGNENSECLYLFGKRAQNRIIPMVDAVNEHQVLKVSGNEFDYVVAADDFEQAQKWAREHGFDEIFTCNGPKGDVAVVFEKVRR